MERFKKVHLPLRMPEAIVRQIEKRIFEGRLKAGQILPPEKELMNQFGVGRNTVREALRILESSGLIKVKQGSRGGPVVTKLTNEFVSDFLMKAMRLQGVSPDQLSEFRLAIEPFMAELVAAKTDINPELISQMENNILDVKKLYKGKKVTAYRNMDFHVLIALATENPMFIVLIRTLRVSFNLISPPQNKIQPITINYHQKILAAIKDRNPVEAREQMHRHMVEMAKVIRGAKMKTWKEEREEKIASIVGK